MNRIEILREYIDKILLDITDIKERRCAYMHLYGVSQLCALIALKRKENTELLVMAGMLHDIYSYAKMDKEHHAHKGAALAKEILTQLKIADNEEIEVICKAIYNHSDKDKTHTSFDEVLIDADVLQHCLYNPRFKVMPNEKCRFGALKKEFGLE